MLIEQYETVKEIDFVFSNLDEKIKGRIQKIIKGPNAAYQWDLSHFCRLEHEMGIYTPSAPFADSISEIESKLMTYVKRFENAVQVVPNQFY
jgi:hypothetical protein